MSYYSIIEMHPMLVLTFPGHATRSHMRSVLPFNFFTLYYRVICDLKAEKCFYKINVVES